VQETLPVSVVRGPGGHTQQAQGKRAQTSVLSLVEASAVSADALTRRRRSEADGAEQAGARRDAPGLPIESDGKPPSSDESKKTREDEERPAPREPWPLLVYPIFSS